MLTVNQLIFIGGKNNSIYDEESCSTQSIDQNLLKTISLVFFILCIICNVHCLLYFAFRLYLPKKIHPKICEVLPSTATSTDYPLVAVQLPMKNEIECYASIIKCACDLDWPKTRLLIQVLDDSTDESIRLLIDRCVDKWYQRGIQIHAVRRTDNEGFKAGNLKNGLNFVSHVPYIAIFDADFLPTTDFLLKTVPILIQDPLVAFVQARWTFTNVKQSFLTRMQEIWFNYHHKCEQEGTYRASFYFGFNGTAGIWRTSAIEQCGGWHTDTLVEDMDLSLRAHLNGWRSVYMCDVECLNELPPTLSAYLSQQHRWNSGPIQVLKKLIMCIIQVEKISFAKKLWCLWFLFRHMFFLFNYTSLLLLIPIVIWAKLTNAICFSFLLVMFLLTLPLTVFTPKGLRLTLFYMLFSNVISLHKARAVIAGLFEHESTKKWITTPKYNNNDNIFTQESVRMDMSNLTKNKILSSIDKSMVKQLSDSYFSYTIEFIFFSTLYNQFHKTLKSYRCYKLNFMTAFYLLSIGTFGIINKQYVIGIYSILNGLMFGTYSFSRI